MKQIKVYKSEEARLRAEELYHQKLKTLTSPVRSESVRTSFGNTHILCMGDESKPPVLIFHGINAGAPVALEAIQGLADSYYLIGVDTPGQATPSDPVRLDPASDEYGIWAGEVCEALGYSRCTAIGVSYGGFILQNMLQVKPERLEKAIFMVPGGVEDGDFWPTFKTITWPLIKFMVTKSESHLKSFLSAFYTEPSEFDRELQRNTLLGVNVDFNRPPKIVPETFKDIKTPVYLITAEQDVFFPSKRVIDRMKTAFPEMADIHVVKNSRHVPAPKHFAEISAKIRSWLK